MSEVVDCQIPARRWRGVNGHVRPHCVHGVPFQFRGSSTRLNTACTLCLAKWDEAVRSYPAHLKSLAFKLVFRKSELDDVVSDALLKLLRSKPAQALFRIEVLYENNPEKRAQKINSYLAKTIQSVIRDAKKKPDSLMGVQSPAVLDDEGNEIDFFETVADDIALWREENEFGEHGVELVKSVLDDADLNPETRQIIEGLLAGENQKQVGDRLSRNQSYIRTKLSSAVETIRRSISFSPGWFSPRRQIDGSLLSALQLSWLREWSIPNTRSGLLERRIAPLEDGRLLFPFARDQRTHYTRVQECGEAHPRRSVARRGWHEPDVCKIRQIVEESLANPRPRLVPPEPEPKVVPSHLARPDLYFETIVDGRRSWVFCPYLSRVQDDPQMFAASVQLLLLGLDVISKKENSLCELAIDI